MQASLRSNYQQQQYYDYGTLDYSTTQIDQSVHEHGHQLREDPVVSIEHQHHHHPLVPNLLSQDPNHRQSPSASDHNHQQENQQLLQTIPHTITFDNRLAEEAQNDSCYIDSQEVSATCNEPIQTEQLVIYNQSQPQHQYQLLTVSDQINSSNEPEVGAGNLEVIEGAENLYQLQAHQQQHIQTTTYQTVYYDPVNYTESCSLEPLQPTNGGPQEHQEAFTSHPIHPELFAGDSQQVEREQPSNISNCVNYFQYHHHQHHQHEELVANQNHHSESPLATTHQQPPHSYVSDQHHAADDAPGQQTYRALGTITNHSFEQLDHINQNAHFYLQNVQVESNSHTISDMQYSPYKQDQCSHTSNSDHQVQLHHNFYLDAESTGVSIAHSRDSHSSSASTSSSEESLASTLTRDEKRAREANIPMTYYEIVNLSIEHFNEQLAKHSLSESQLTLIKDIRRRGKNKVAAQSCRKRKMEQIYELQHEVNHLASKRRSLSYERSQLIKEHGNLVQEYDKIKAIIQSRIQCETMK